MNKSILIFLITILFGCGQKSQYNDYEINGIKVKIDQRLTSKKKEYIIWMMENNFSTRGSFYIKNLTGITYDSLLYSYLVTLHSKDSLNPDNLAFMKAYTELLSDDIFDKRPVHMFISQTGQYIEYDTTALKSYGVTEYQKGQLRLETRDIGNFTLGGIGRMLERSFRLIKFEGQLIGTLSVDSTVFTVDFVLDPAKHNAIQFRDSVDAIDAYYKYLILNKDHLLVNFKDSTGNKLTKSIYFQ